MNQDLYFKVDDSYTLEAVLDTWNCIVVTNEDLDLPVADITTVMNFDYDTMYIKVSRSGLEVLDIYPSEGVLIDPERALLILENVANNGLGVAY